MSRFLPSKQNTKTPAKMPLPTSVGTYQGLSPIQASALMQELHNLGILQGANYRVRLRPYQSNSKIAQLKIPLYMNLSSSLKQPHKVVSLPQKIPLFYSQDGMGKLVDYLAKSVEISALDAQNDGIQVGSLTLNHFTGNSTSDISIAFIDSRNGMIYNSCMAIKELMFNVDGTQAPPKDYLMVLSVEVLDRHCRVPVIQQDWVVALQTANMSLSSDDQSSTVTNVTFTKMFPMLSKRKV